MVSDTVLAVYSNAVIKHSARALRTQAAHKALPVMKGCKSVKADHYLHRSCFKTETITGERDYFKIKYIFHAAFRQNLGSLIYYLESLVA